MIVKSRKKRLARPESPRLRILIVDENGVAALQAARRLQPDVILLDLGLPRMDGFEVARQLRADAAFRDVLIIAVTGFASEDDRKRSREVGIDHHLVKPADPAFIESLLRRRR